jgi:hypothetical protein
MPINEAFGELASRIPSDGARPEIPECPAPAVWRPPDPFAIIGRRHVEHPTLPSPFIPLSLGILYG